jgi:hypothetical protein
MRIEKVLRQYSSENELACKTAPSLDPWIYKEFEKLLANTTGFVSVQFRWDGGLLYVKTPSFTPILISNIENLLTAAEKSLEAANAARCKQEKIEKEKKEGAINANANAAGIPIE